MICKKCGSSNVTIKDDHYVQEKTSSVLLNIFLSVITCGIWLVWLLLKLLSGKSRKSILHNRRVAICNNCGASYVLEDKIIR